MSGDGSVYDVQAGRPDLDQPPAVARAGRRSVSFPLPAVARAVAHNSETRTFDFVRARLKGLLG